MDWNSLLSDDPDLLFTRYTDRYFPYAATTCVISVTSRPDTAST